VQCTINKPPTGLIETLPLGAGAPSVPDHWPPPKRSRAAELTAFRPTIRLEMERRQRTSASGPIADIRGLMLSKIERALGSWQATARSLLREAPRLARPQVDRARLVFSLRQAQPGFNVMGTKAKTRSHCFYRVMSRIGVHLPSFARLSVIFDPSRFHQPRRHGCLVPHSCFPLEPTTSTSSASTSRVGRACGAITSG